MDETIAAIATAYGEGGIGIIRISGENAESIVNKIFKTANGKQLKNRMLTYGNVIDPVTNEIVDEAMAVFMKAPHTYTCEDVAEIDCHGSVASLRKTLAIVLENGARLAEKGEFTKRAFLNGRLDLSQAEAVMDLISAKTEKSFEISLKQLKGNISAEIGSLRKKLLDMLVDLTVNIDYPDEDIEEITYEKLEHDILEVITEIKKLMDSSETGRIIKEGLKVTITGKPNVGKSSLMNAVLKEERAIVTDIPGTTRDTIEESVSIKNIPVIITDTAGIRETEEKIEKIGIEKSKEAFNNADLIIFVIDGSRPLDEEDKKIINIINERNCIVVINKNDLEQKIKEDEIKNLIPQCIIIKTTLKANNNNNSDDDLIKKGKTENKEENTDSENKGIKEIEDCIENMVFKGKITQNESMMITNVRHFELLRQSESNLRDALEMTQLGEALDFIEIDVKEAYEKLGEIIGESVSEDIINEVFSRFCLGK